MSSIVFLDLNRNGILDSGEPNARTDKYGKYSFILTSAQKKASLSGYAPIIIFGGVDTSTAKPFRGRLRAPLSLRTPRKKVTVTPITTLLAYNIEENILATKSFTTEYITSIINIQRQNYLQY